MAKKTKRKIGYRTLPMAQQFNLRQEGKHFDLGKMFDQVNKRYFRGRVRNYTVEWGRRRKNRPKDHFVFGTIQEQDRVIRIHPLLDQAFVPRWYVKYVLFHEMLHSVVPDKLLRSGRRQVHTEEFNRRERQYWNYDRARRWEERNLARFLR
jgi:hypothetical protein